MYKNDGGINIDRISVVDNSYHNGIEVSIVTNTTIDAIYDAVKELALFKNLEVQYIDGLYPPNCMESYDEYTNFWYNKNTYIPEKQVAVGNVLYTVPEKYSLDTLKGNIVPKLQVGSVDVTPNRENLLFNKKTLDTLSAAYSKSLEEIQEIAQHSPVEVSTISEFYKSWYAHRLIDSKGNAFYYGGNDDCRRFILKGKEISLDIPPDPRVLHYEFSLYSCAFLKGRKYSPKFICASYSENYEVIIKESPRFKQGTKDYIKDEYPTSIVIDPKDIFSIKRSLIKNVGKKEAKFIFENTPIVKIANEDVPKEYNTPNKKENRSSNNIIKIRGYSPEGKYNYCELNPHNIKRRFREGCLYIYAEHSRVQEALEYVRINRVCVCTLKADDLWIMKSLPNAVYIDNIFDSCYGVLRKAATCRIIHDYYESKNLSCAQLRQLRVFDEYCSGEMVPKKLANIYFKRGWIKYGMLSNKIFSQNEIDALARIKNILSNGAYIIKNYILSHVGIYPQFGYNLKDYTDINKLKSTTV